MPSGRRLQSRSRLSAALLVLSAAACRGPEREPPRLGSLPDFRLTSAASAPGPRAFTPRDLDGAPWVADFIFTSCSGPCPLLSTRMAALQRTLPRQVRLVSFTVDPDADTPAVLRAYSRRYAADPSRWNFVTGDKAALFGLLRDGFKLPVVEDAAAPAGVRVTHSTKFALVDSARTVRGYFDGQDKEELAALERAAKSLLSGPIP
ncbi:MAG: SCO family protein [Elusimicrobia bacterium]|nr:SCO family protein [Elusimicrobiota bacterium]